MEINLKLKIMYRNKTYLCFDGDNDIHYYRLMCAWKANNNDFFRAFNFYDAHEINYARDSSSEYTIKTKLLERLRNSSKFVVLVGDHTRYLTKFVRWEIEKAIELNIPIIAVNLNNKKSMDSMLCPPILQNALSVHVSFNAKIINHALSNWPDSHASYRSEGKTGSYYYTDKTYESLGL